MERPEPLSSLTVFLTEIKSKYEGEKKTLLFWLSLKGPERRSKKLWSKRGGEKRSLIFLSAPTGSAEREQGKMEKKGKREMYYSTSVMTINI